MAVVNSVVVARLLPLELNICYLVFVFGYVILVLLLVCLLLIVGLFGLFGLAVVVLGVFDCWFWRWPLAWWLCLRVLTGWF